MNTNKTVLNRQPVRQNSRGKRGLLDTQRERPLASGRMPSRKPHKYFIATLAAALAFVSATPSISLGAGEPSKLERTRKSISEIRKKVQEAKSDAGLIATQVTALDGQINDLNRQIRTGRHDISLLESNIRQTQKDIDDTQTQYQTAVDTSNERARSLYKAGPVSFISGLLSAKSLGQFMRMSVLYRVAAESDGSVMIRASRLKADLSDQKTELLGYRENLDSQKKWLEQRRNLVAEARNERAIALAAVEGQIDQDEAQIAALEKEARALTAVIKASNFSKSTGAVSTSGFIWPTANHKINQGYSRRHPGIDIDGDTGDPIVAVKAGFIGQVGCSGGYGICTLIDHGNGVSTLYGHQSRRAIGTGHVNQGQVIGYVGCSGHCTGPHLHFETRVNGEPRNPFTFLP
jgi:murein DD-endopeptidase MepM/ murein hydrolase activator NlpD